MVAALIGLPVVITACAMQQSGGASGGPISFFVTSVGAGKGADLGGLAGADKHCQNLAMTS